MPFTETLVRLSLRDQVFLGVAVAIGLLLAVSFLFTVAILLHRYVEERRQGRRTRLERVVEPLILEVLAGAASEESVQRRVAARDRVHFIALLLEYAHAIRGEELETVRRLAAPHLELVAKQVRSPVPERRARALRSLSTLAPASYDETIVEALDDPSPMVALIAAHALAETGGTPYAGPILDRLDRFGNWSADYLSEMIASMGSGVTPDLRAVYLDPEAPPRVRAIAADAIRQIGDPGGADMALQVLEKIGAADGPEREIATASLRILARTGRAEHIPIVRRFVDRGDPVIRALAISALGELGGPDDVPRVVAAVDDDSRWVAVHAARALKKMRATDELKRVAARADGYAPVAHSAAGADAAGSPGEADAAGSPGGAGADRAELAREVLAE